MNVGYLESCVNELGNDYVFGRVQSVVLGNGWGFFGIFCCVNILFVNIDKLEMIDVEKDYWCVVGYFFYLYWYMEFINCFGVVFWVNMVFNENFFEVYGFCVDCEIVVDFVLNCLKWVEVNIGDFEK